MIIPDGAEGLLVPGMAFAVLLILLITTLAPPQRQPWRAIVAGLSAGLAVGFLVWRIDGVLKAAAADDASVFLYVGSAIDVLALLDFLVFILLISRFKDRRPASRAHALALAAADPASLPHVDVWIATYNEEWAILEKTLIAALALDWPADQLHIYVLDDGRRDWLALRCAEFGVTHVTRADNAHHKAGNHNNALRCTAAPFILSLDADFIVFPQAIRHLIGFFAEADIAIVQSPQAFYNPEPFRNNLLLHRLLPDDLDLFYKVMQPGRDAWNATFYCGTSAMLRRAALIDVGGFATQGDIEDQITSMKLWQHGWRTIFVGEQLSVGLAPESLAALHDQRNRWCRGSLQIMFTPHSPLGRGFTVIQRLLFSQSYWVLGSLIPLYYAVLPGLVWLFGARLFSHVTLGEVIAIPILLVVGIWTALAWLSERTWVPIISPAFQLFMAVELLPTALASLIKPFGKPLFKISPVTAKGRDATRHSIDWVTFLALMAIMLGTIAAMGLAAFGPRGEIVDVNEMLTAMGWTVLDLGICSVALLTCFELPYRRTEERFGIIEPSKIEIAGSVFSGWTENLSLGGALIQLATTVGLETGQNLIVSIGGLPPFPAEIRRVIAENKLAIAFAPLGDSERALLIRRVFLGPEPKPAPISVHGMSILDGVVRRLTRSDF
ncbi:MAG: glycosyltransferase [Acetobacteraceae bacterium]|nr:glycosyltransferase [Acetobacteraceae bacterium]